ncbi:MAG: putative zinc-binding peptidase [Tepidisphaeraceae bacterium]
MRRFNCDHCGQLIFFESTVCVTCQRTLACIEDLVEVTSLDPVGDGTWTSPVPEAAGKKYKLCENYTKHQVCNWAIAADDPNTLCEACRLTRTIPDLSAPNARQLWYKMEVAKKRLLYTLFYLGLPHENKHVDPENGLIFDILADPADPNAPKVMTGHANGVITLALAEADDAEREKRRLAMHEPFRTLLGHFRHEVGHYYWDVLIKPDPKRLEAFRKLFGDDQVDYGAALQKHYNEGSPPDWQTQYISEYATMHAWEDWAETWAHYLHIVDTLENASELGIQIRPDRRGEPAVKSIPDPVKDDASFKEMMAAWGPLTYVMNSLNRSLGIGDAYPFVLSGPAVEKLRFVHKVVTDVGKN